MKVSASSKLRDGATTLSGVALIVAGMAIVDENARRLLVRVVRGDLQLGVTFSDLRLQPIMRSVTDMVGPDHTQMATFALMSFVLFVVMFRT